MKGKKKNNEKEYVSGGRKIYFFFSYKETFLKNFLCKKKIFFAFLSFASLSWLTGLRQI